MLPSFRLTFATCLIKRCLAINTEPVNRNSECNGVGTSWESDEKMCTQSNYELEPQDGVDSFSLFPSRDRVPWNSSPLSSSRSPSSSVTNPPQPEEKTEAVSNIRKQLRGCLKNVHNGSFATSSALPNAADPAFFVPGLGGVGTPYVRSRRRSCFRYGA